MTEHEAEMTTNDPAAAVLERARVLVDDLRLSEVVRWKAAHPGQLAVGYMPIYVPRPMLEGIGCLPVAMFGGGDQVDIIKGDSFYQSYICHIPRSTLELALNGALDPLDGVLFPSICDVIRNLSGMWQMLFPDKYASYVDLPQNFDPELGGKFYMMDMARILKDLTARGAWAYDADKMRAAIVSENSRRAALHELDTLRVKEPFRVRASEAYLIARAGGLLEASAHEELVREFVAAAKQRATRVYDNVRVLVRGSFCEQPPLGLIKTLEAAGCDIVDDDFQLGLRYIEGDIECGPKDDPMRAIAMAFLKRGQATASRYIADEEKGKALIDSVHAVEAEGVIFAAASFCDPALLDQPMLEAALDRAKIPHTSLKFAENTGQFQVIREQAGAFSDAVKLWGSAA
ncbi:MAG: benzoyl-CoA reductase subunit C [Polyangiaceae bacterium]|nr:benzoyl-CoA reductase subunit C [Polyangiaceae bacterium]MBK9001515.1 benzoyl-CoA reductase subunit C [Myxococcales bacterium]MCL4753331.1 benzoyl-CoA reductase subunit C [Myxococcales bacterium]